MSLAPGTSDPAANNMSWSNIWTLNVPNKVKHFIWRACHESLPTKKNLLIRKVTRNSICERCQSEIEDTVHALWGCQLWSTGAFWDSGAGVGLGNFLYIYIENIFFLYIFTIKILLKNTLLSLIHKTKKEKGKKHSEMRISIVPARFKANFGLFWPFRSVLAISVAGQYGPILAESAQFGANPRKKKKKQQQQQQTQTQHRHSVNRVGRCV